MLNEKVNFWRMHIVSGRKIIPLILFILLGTGLKAQFNALSFDQKFLSRPLHFGILMGFNKSDFLIRHSSLYLYNDSIARAESVKGPGFTLGIVSDLRIGEHFDLRALPSMSFSEKKLVYDTFQDTTFSKSIESIFVELPLLLKFKSAPYKDMRVYIIAGGKYSYDLSSNAKARNAEDLVKIKRNDISVEYGLGFEFYFPMFIFAPEFRFSRGLFDV